MLDPLLGVMESSGVVTYPMCAPAVPAVLLFLSSGLQSLPFFLFISPFYCVDGLWSCLDIVSTDISPLLWLWLDKLICFLVNMKDVDPIWRYCS